MLIVDDHRMVADALRSALGSAPGIEVVALAHDREQALEAAGDKGPDVAIVDYALGDTDGLEVVKDLRIQSPGLRVLLMTGGGNEMLVARARDAGCDGFLHKSEPVDQMIATVRAIDAGSKSFPKRELARADQLLHQNGQRIGEDLTSREREVLQMLADGASTEEMVSALFVSTHTVRSHVRHILEKLGAHSKLQAVSIATRAGLVSVGDNEPT